MIKKKKVAFIIPSLEAGGAERVAVTLANKFINENEVFLLVLNKTKTMYTVDNSIQIHFLKEAYIPSVNWFIALKNNFRFIKQLIKIVRHNKIDILISFTTTANILVILSNFFIKSASYISERNNPEVYQLSLFRKISVRILYHFTDALIVQASFSKKYFQHFLKPKKIQIIPNPIDENLLSRREEYGKRDNIILTVGRLDANKNQKLLLEAFANLNTKNWRLVLVGDGVLKTEYQMLAKRLGIANKVDFIGTVSNIEDYYNSAKLFVFTSQSEGFPNALLEALSFGIPCIASDCNSGPSEMIKHTENGFLFENNNQKQLEKQMSKLMENEELRLKFSSNAIQSTAKYHPDEIYKQWKSLVFQGT
ncbi:glycosyltransferase family 4 protein [Flavobacterium sp. M31R6]|uniref:glycosyltransferase family 4 protein n=1 Tax=Flavobacterium sp. M31R6 TaxID=2739062 RepID=UPI001568599D|nr:glycosyltransferase family 4 protein [Flavobacterium sp. M31R6]QKJ64450.1 glycosyltransferase family 4 protein [Flavobacterium sp. M31R6]